MKPVVQVQYKYGSHTGGTKFYRATSIVITNEHGIDTNIAVYNWGKVGTDGQFQIKYDRPSDVFNKVGSKEKRGYKFGMWQSCNSQLPDQLKDLERFLENACIVRRDPKVSEVWAKIDEVLKASVAGTVGEPEPAFPEATDDDIDRLFGKPKKKDPAEDYGSEWGGFA